MTKTSDRFLLMRIKQRNAQSKLDKQARKQAVVRHTQQDEPWPPGDRTPHTCRNSNTEDKSK